MANNEQHQYNLHMNKIIIRVIPKTAEFRGYFQQWLDGTWPSKHFFVSSIEGKDYILTDPSNILYIEVNYGTD